jgi:signal transduction histidine kinase
MVPMTTVMLVTVIAVSVCHAYLAAEQTRRRTAMRIRDVCDALAGSGFPMTRAILEQMKGLSGADFLVRDGEGRLLATTRESWQTFPTELSHSVTKSSRLELAEPIMIGGERLLHAALALGPSSRVPSGSILHVLYPESVYLAEQRRATLPALGIGGAAIVLVVFLALLTASRVSRPLSNLRHQVNRIAAGDFRPITLPRRHDEVRELAWAVNHMAGTLAQYEQRIRRTEQLRLLTQLAGGLAHQLRNSATGARMALDIHRGECAAADSESLIVASRQLTLIEEYLARFLTLAPSRQRRRERIDFAQLIRQLLPLVQPAAQHMGVALSADIAQTACGVEGDPDALEQVVLNLLLNAIEAAGQASVRESSEAATPRVHLTLAGRGGDRLRLLVDDTGPGPPAEIAESMFEPFVTTKPEGTGLGLAVVRDVVLDHGGKLDWERRSAAEEGAPHTRFSVELPLVTEG